MSSIINEAGEFRKAYALSSRPPRRFHANPKSGKSRGKPVPIFEPYPEALPLEAGYYTFVIDDLGRFRVERGNTSSHAAMVNREPIGAAGWFTITRAGKVGIVFCRSVDYRFSIPNREHPTVHYVIDAFQRSQAFDVSPYAYFRFTSGPLNSFAVDLNCAPLESYTERDKLLETEGQGTASSGVFTPAQLAAFQTYQPIEPPRLYSMHDDQRHDPIDYDDHQILISGEAKPAYSPGDGLLTSGRKAFVIDQGGNVILGFGHHLLSGGQPVGAAGQIVVDEESVIREIHLNFSGHYRPPLKADYARYTYRVLTSHPLLRFADDCKITARKFFDINSPFELITIPTDELIADDLGLEHRCGELDDVWEESGELTDEEQGLDDDGIEPFDD